MSYEVYDNILSDHDAESIESLLLGEQFPWYFNQYVINHKKESSLNHFQFVHVFHDGIGIRSDSWQIINPLLDVIGMSAILRIKSNLIPIAEEITIHGYHSDFSGLPLPSKSAVYYVNTNNGFTIFENGDKVDSVKNRLLVFDNDMRHSGTTCTDKKARVVINFNFF